MIVPPAGILPGMSDTPAPTVWPILAYRDAPAAIAFLKEAFGFTEAAVYTRDGDDSVVEHAELRWPLGGGLMLATAGRDETAFGRREAGAGALYVVCDDPDGLFARATAAGAEVVHGLVDQDYGAREFSVRDSEGNLWSFGTYQGAGQ